MNATYQHEACSKNGGNARMAQSLLGPWPLQLLHCVCTHVATNLLDHFATMLSHTVSRCFNTAANRRLNQARGLPCHRLNALPEVHTIPEKCFEIDRPVRKERFSVPSKAAVQVLQAIDKGERYLAITGPPDTGTSSAGKQVASELQRRGEDVLFVSGDISSILQEVKTGDDWQEWFKRGLRVSQKPKPSWLFIDRSHRLALHTPIEGFKCFPDALKRFEQECGDAFKGIILLDSGYMRSFLTSSRSASFATEGATENQHALNTKIVPERNVLIMDRFTKEDIKNLLCQWIAYENAAVTHKPSESNSETSLPTEAATYVGCTVDELASNIHAVTAGHKGLAGLVCYLLPKAISKNNTTGWHEFAEALLNLCSHHHSDAGLWYFKTALQILFDEKHEQIAVQLYGEHYKKLRLPIQTMLWQGCIEVSEADITDYGGLLARGAIRMHPASDRTEADVLFQPNPEKVVKLTTPSPLYTAIALQRFIMPVIKVDPPTPEQQQALDMKWFLSQIIGNLDVNAELMEEPCRGFGLPGLNAVQRQSYMLAQDTLNQLTLRCAHKIKPHFEFLGQAVSRTACVGGFMVLFHPRYHGYDEEDTKHLGVLFASTLTDAELQSAVEAAQDISRRYATTNKASENNFELYLVNITLSSLDDSANMHQAAQLSSDSCNLHLVHVAVAADSNIAQLYFSAAERAVAVQLPQTSNCGQSLRLTENPWNSWRDFHSYPDEWR